MGEEEEEEEKEEKKEGQTEDEVRRQHRERTELQFAGSQRDVKNGGMWRALVKSSVVPELSWGGFQDEAVTKLFWRNCVSAINQETSS